MLNVGITGSIGAGKTVACNVFKTLGVPVFNSDTEARILINTDPLIKAALINAFGNEVYLENGQLDKTRMATLIFSDSDARQKVNSIVHPVVKKKFDEWRRANEGHKYVLQEAAILFESGAWRFSDKIIVVTAPEKTRIDRIMKRDGSDHDSVKNIIASQLSDDEKIKKADYIIYNDTTDLLLPQILKLHEELCSLA